MALALLPWPRRSSVHQSPQAGSRVEDRPREQSPSISQLWRQRLPAYHQPLSRNCPPLQASGSAAQGSTQHGPVKARLYAADAKARGFCNAACSTGAAAATQSSYASAATLPYPSFCSSWPAICGLDPAHTTLQPPGSEVGTNMGSSLQRSAGLLPGKRSSHTASRKS